MYMLSPLHACAVMSNKCKARPWVSHAHALQRAHTSAWCSDATVKHAAMLAPLEACGVMLAPLEACSVMLAPEAIGHVDEV